LAQSCQIFPEAATVLSLPNNGKLLRNVGSRYWYSVFADGGGITAISLAIGKNGRADSLSFLTEDNEANKDCVWLESKCFLRSLRFLLFENYIRSIRVIRGVFKNSQTSRVRDPKILRSTPVNGRK
jgi:hypothetical protein